MLARAWLPLGALAGLLAVALGAFGAHALKDRLTGEFAAVYRTAVEYHFYHALALALVGVLARQKGAALLDAAGAAFTLGLLLFSGSLYVLALTGVRGWGAVTPAGGVAFLAGWGLLAAYALLR